MKYIKKGTGKNLILLHGWSCNKEIFSSMIKNFQCDFTIWSLDLPGFGESEIIIPMTVNDYCEKLNEFILDNNIVDPIILGHSFGGRIAIKYASKYNCYKLILVDSAGIKRTNFKVIKYKVIKKFYSTLKMKKSLLKLREKYSSSDYKKASNIMKNTLKLAVNYDQKKDLKKITCETLLIWGENDQATKVKDCYLMNKILYDSGMVVLKDTGHFPFIEKEKEFNIILENYLESEKDD